MEHALFSVIVLRKAQRVIEGLAHTLDGEEVEDVVGSLADDPDPPEAWTPDGDPGSRFIYVGENRKWMIVYEIDEEGSVVYVHSVERRPSADLDPR